MAKLLSGTRIYGNATVDTSITVGTNVAAANVVITNASRLGTVTSGTWNGSSISTTYTDAKVTSVNGQTGAATGFATTANTLAQFASTTSAQLATLISDETGSGALVFATTPTLVTPVLGLATGTSVMLSANIGAAAGNISGNFTAGTLQTTGNVNASSLSVTSASTLGTVQSGTWNGSSISTTYTDAKVTTVAGQTGAISNAQLASAVSASGILTTANVTEVTNLYFTNARSRTSISTTGTKGSYNNSTGVFDFANIANVNVTSSAPSSPNIGDQWIDNATGKSFIYFNDGTSSQWVEQLFNAVYYADLPTTVTVRIRAGTYQSVPLTNGNLPVRNRNGSTSNVIIS